MKQFIAIINDKQVGPNTIGELIALGLNGDTYVWNPEMSGWTHASETNEYKIAVVGSSSPSKEIDNPEEIKLKGRTSTEGIRPLAVVTQKQKQILIIAYVAALFVGLWLGLKGVYYLAYLNAGQTTGNAINMIISLSGIWVVGLIIIAFIFKHPKKFNAYKYWKIVLLGSGVFFVCGLGAFSAYKIKGKPTDEYNWIFAEKHEKYAATPGRFNSRNALIDNWGNTVVEESDCVYRIEDNDTKEIKYLIINFIDRNVARFDLYRKSNSGLIIESTKHFRYLDNREDVVNSNEYYYDADRFITQEYGSEEQAYHSKYVYYNSREIK